MFNSACRMDDSQIHIPESFTALYLLPGRAKPSEPAAHIAQRYELCEDMATMLAEQAGQLEWKLGIGEAAVLDRMAQGLAALDVGLTAAEQDWVLHRLAEILDWLAHVQPRTH
jgi:hypothetical protein